MTFCLALRVVVLLLPGVLAPAVLTGKGFLGFAASTAQVHSAEGFLRQAGGPGREPVTGMMVDRFGEQSRRLRYLEGLGSLSNLGVHIQESRGALAQGSSGGVRGPRGQTEAKGCWPSLPLAFLQGSQRAEPQDLVLPRGMAWRDR